MLRNFATVKVTKPGAEFFAVGHAYGRDAMIQQKGGLLTTHPSW